ncbi:hypothetical protein [Pedomonas sp. V897]|uniref:hypothetical protein n=1 Tax=Pedomonas sp. V897 TaxID=3446482 RepID=UPI003EDEB059
MKPLSSQDWLGKSSAGLILGFLLALGLSGLFKLANGVEEAFFSLKGQFSMWMISPIWGLILSFCFLFGSPARAWGWLGLANLLLWGALWALGGIAL